MRGKEWSAALSHVVFLKSDWLSFSLKGLLCILQKGALSEMDTWLTENFAFAFLPSQPPVLSLPSYSTLEPLGIIWKCSGDAVSWLVSRGVEGAWLCCGSRPLLPAVSPWCFQVL